MCVFLSGKRAAPYYIYTSHNGGDVTIKCDLKFTESQLSKGYTVKWTKDYRAVFSNFSSNVVISSGFTGRVKIVNGTSLKISRLKKTDETYYRCYVKLVSEIIEKGDWIRLNVNSKLDNHL